MTILKSCQECNESVPGVDPSKVSEASHAVTVTPSGHIVMGYYDGKSCLDEAHVVDQVSQLSHLSCWVKARYTPGDQLANR